MTRWLAAPGWQSRASLVLVGVLLTPAGGAAAGKKSLPSQVAPPSSTAKPDAGEVDDDDGDEDEGEGEDEAAEPGPHSSSPGKPRAPGPLDRLLAVAKAQEQRGEPGRARQAFVRALQLSPHSPAAMRGLLWVLIEQRDEEALKRALLHFARPAAQDPQLWRGYAAGLCALSRYSDALPWFARGMGLERPTAKGPRGRHDSFSLWLADYVYALLRSGRSRAAARLLPLAVAELRRVAHRQKTRGAAGRADLAALTLSKLRGWQFDSEFVGGQLARLRVAAEAGAATEDALAEDDDDAS
jgi:tetratricopeptide (TPR) repeat protein